MIIYPLNGHLASNYFPCMLQILIQCLLGTMLDGVLQLDTPGLHHTNATIHFMVLSYITYAHLLGFF